MTMVYLTDGVDRPSDLAAKLRVSKQATQQALKELQAKGIIELVPDPDNGRQKLVLFTEHGRTLQKVAKHGLYKLEAELSKRVGVKSMLQLREALDADWGSPPQ